MPYTSCDTEVSIDSKITQRSSGYFLNELKNKKTPKLQNVQNLTGSYISNTTTSIITIEQGRVRDETIFDNLQNREACFQALRQHVSDKVVTFGLCENIVYGNVAEPTLNTSEDFLTLDLGNVVTRRDNFPWCSIGFEFGVNLPQGIDDITYVFRELDKSIIRKYEDSLKEIVRKFLVHATSNQNTDWKTILQLAAEQNEIRGAAHCVPTDLNIIAHPLFYHYSLPQKW